MFLQDIEALFSTVDYVFANIVPVRKILIILGPSIISPKESFMINFPTDFYEGAILSHKSCMRKVFRQLIAKNFLDNTKPPNSGTSLFLLFWAPRNCNYEAARLLPKLSFNAPNRGLRFFINFTFSHVVKRSPNISLTDDKVDISGIELLDDSLGDGPSDSSNASSLLHKSTCVADATSCLEHSDQTESDDYIWYQSSTVIKGFKEKLNDGNKIWKLSWSNTFTDMNFFFKANEQWFLVASAFLLTAYDHFNYRYILYYVNINMCAFVWCIFWYCDLPINLIKIV